MKAKSIVIIGLIVVMLAGVFAGVLLGQSPLEIRAASATAVSGWQQMGGPRGEPIWVSPASVLTSADIERTERRAAPVSDPTVGVVFTADGAKKMAKLSAAQSGKLIALLLDGKVIWAPIVRGAIEKEAVLTGLTPAQADRLVQVLP